MSHFQGQKELKIGTSESSSQLNLPKTSESTDSNDPASALEKLSINQAPWNKIKTATRPINSSQQIFAQFQQNSSADQTINQDQTSQIISTAGTFQPQTFLTETSSSSQNVNQNTNQNRPIVFTTKPANFLHEKIIPREIPVVTSGNVLYRTLSASSNMNINQQNQLRPKSADSFSERNLKISNLQPGMTKIYQNINQNIHEPSLANSSQIVNKQPQINSMHNQQQQRAQSSGTFQPENVSFIQQRATAQVSLENNQQPSNTTFVNTGTAAQGRFLNVVDISHMRTPESQQQFSRVSQQNLANDHNRMQQSPIRNQNQPLMQSSIQMPLQRSQSHGSLQSPGHQVQKPPTNHQQNTQMLQTSNQHQMQRSTSNQSLNNQTQGQNRQDQIQHQNNQIQMPIQNNSSNTPNSLQTRWQMENSQKNAHQNMRGNTRNSL